MRRCRRRAIMNGVVVRGSRRTVLISLLAALCAMAQAGLQEAVSLTRQGRYADARRALSGAAEPVDVRQKIAFRRLKAAIASGLKEAAVAADEMRAALKLSPADSQLLLGTAVAELQAGQLNGALEHAQRAGYSAAGQALAGDIQQKRGKFPEAVIAYQEASRLAPGNEPYRNAL